MLTLSWGSTGSAEIIKLNHEGIAGVWMPVEDFLDRESMLKEWKVKYERAMSSIEALNKAHLLEREANGSHAKELENENLMLKFKYEAAVTQVTWLQREVAFYKSTTTGFGVATAILALTRD